MRIRLTRKWSLYVGVSTHMARRGPLYHEAFIALRRTA